MKKPTQNMFVEETDNDQEEPQAQVVEEKPSAIEKPANYIDLPSKGKLGYESFVTYRDIMVEDEEKLTTATAETWSRTINSVIKAILNDCPFYEKMSLMDRDYVLIWLWSNNYSPIKSMTSDCKNCGNKEAIQVDLTKLKITEIHEKFKKDFTIQVKKTGKPVKIRLNTVQDEIDAEIYNAQFDPEHQADKILDDDFLLRVASVDLPIPFASKIDWVRKNISSQEMGIIRRYHTVFRYGAPTTFEHKCSKCKEVTQYAIPFSASDILYPEVVSADIDDILLAD